MGLAFRSIGSKGAGAWQDDQFPWKTYKALGDGATAFNIREGLAFDDTTNRPSEFVNTLGGTSPITAGVAAGYPLLITTGGTEYNGVNMQRAGEVAKLVAGSETFLRGKFLPSEEKTVDFLFGLCELKTDLMRTASTHGVTSTAVAGVFFVKVSHASDVTILLKSFVSGAETSSVAVGTLSKTVATDLAMWWDGTRLHAYVNDVERAQVSVSLPAGELTPSINFRTGATAAFTLSIAELSFASFE
jgi:hypothetical protein